MSVPLTPLALACLLPYTVSTTTASLHHTAVTVTLLCESEPVGVVCPQYRTSDRAVMPGIFRAGEFVAAQTFIRRAKG